MLLRTTLLRVKAGYGIACLYAPVFHHQHHHHRRRRRKIIMAVDSLLTRSYIRYLIVSLAVILGFFVPVCTPSLMWTLWLSAFGL
jgi:hypothetical protein